MGLAIGIALLESESRLRVRIVEKEFKSGLHASGRNSGVLHAGFYYSPDSLKARFCKEGNKALRQLASKHGVPVKNVGKVVVAKNEETNLAVSPHEACNKTPHFGDVWCWLRLVCLVERPLPVESL